MIVRHVKNYYAAPHLMHRAHFQIELEFKNTYILYIYGEKNIVLVFVPRVDSDK